MPYLLSILYGYDIPSEGLIERERNHSENPIPDWSHLETLPDKVRRKWHIQLDHDVESQGFQFLA